MLKQQMQYGAVYAKVMAMYGKMLRSDEWRRLSECKGVTEICTFLRNHRGWNETMAEIPPSPTAKILETAVRKRVYEEYEKLYKFLGMEDKKYLRFFQYRAEYDFILDALREKRSEQALPRDVVLTDFMRKYSSVDLEALAHGKNYSSILSAVKDSIYLEPLSGLKVDPDTGRPSYWEAGVALENAYYREIFSYLFGHYKGVGRKKLEETLGLEADLINITGVLRLQRSFRASLDKAEELLIPVSYQLKPEFLRTLLSAKSEAEALELLRRSQFGKHLEWTDTQNIESIFYGAMEKFCRKLIRDVSAGLGVPQAYLILKELECRKLGRVIEAVDKGIDPKNVI